MMKHKIGKIEYENATSDEVLGRLKEISEIEVVSTQSGMPESGYYEPAYLSSNGRLSSPTGWLASEMSSQLSFGYNEKWGTIIRVRREGVPITRRALQAIRLAELEPSQQIEDLVQFLFDKIGIKTIASLIKLEKEDNKYSNSCLTYLEKIGEFTRETKLNLYDDKYAKLDFHDKEGIAVKHLVKPTFVMPADY